MKTNTISVDYENCKIIVQKFIRKESEACVGCEIFYIIPVVTKAIVGQKFTYCFERDKYSDDEIYNSVFKKAKEYIDDGGILRKVAKIEAEAGFFLEAKKTAKNISGIYKRSVAFMFIAEAEVKAGLLQEAKETAKEIGYENDLFETLINIAESEKEKGLIPSEDILLKCEEIIKGIDDKDDKDYYSEVFERVTKFRKSKAEDERKKEWMKLNEEVFDEDAFNKNIKISEECVICNKKCYIDE